jgi:hypothetical protein
MLWLIWSRPVVLRKCSQPSPRPQAKEASVGKADMTMNTTKQFRIGEPDLAILEKALPILHEAASLSPMYSRPDVTVAIEECKRILSDVRWDYGPYSHVECTTPEQSP